MIHPAMGGDTLGWWVETLRIFVEPMSDRLDDHLMIFPEPVGTEPLYFSRERLYPDLTIVLEPVRRFVRLTQRAQMGSGAYGMEFSLFGQAALP